MALTKESLHNALGNVTFPTVDYASNFMSGLPTNINAVVGNATALINDVQSSAETLVGIAENTWKNIRMNAEEDMGGAVGAVIGSAMGVAASAESVVATTTGLRKMFTSETIEFTQKIIAETVKMLLQLSVQFPIEIAKKYAKKLLPRTAERIKQMVESIVVDNDKKSLADRSENIQSKIANTAKNLQNQAGGLTGKVKDWGDTAASKMKDASKWVCLGEDYMINKYNSLMDECKGAIIEWRDSKIAEIRMKQEEDIEKISDEWADHEANDNAGKYRDDLKRTLDKTNSKLEKIKIKALTIIRTAVMTLLAEIGV